MANRTHRICKLRMGGCSFTSTTLLLQVHAPNERHRLSMYHLSQRAYVKLLFELGRGELPAGSTEQNREEL